MPERRRRRMLALLPVALAVPAGAQDKPAPPSYDGKPIVITGVRLSDLQRALAACLARRCPPDQDIAATLKVAESQFVDGDYRAARTTLQKSIGRNHRFAKTWPVEVSSLLRANYRVAEHLGDGDGFRIGTFDTVDALKTGLPDGDPRVLAGQIEVGDMYAQFGRLDEAVDKYRAIERRATALGLFNIQGMARLRIVALYAQSSAAAYGQPGGGVAIYKAEARKAAAALLADPDQRLKPYAQAARVVLARLDVKTGDAAAVDRLIADFRAMNGGIVPVLLYAPPIKPIDPLGVGQQNESVARTARGNYDGEWVDIGFWVTPEGRIADLDVLRSGRGGSAAPYWTKPILTAIAARRYAPLAMDPAQPGVMRVERYTLTAWLVSVTGSRMVTREASPRIEMLDLSVDPPAGPGR